VYYYAYCHALRCILLQQLAAQQDNDIYTGHAVLGDLLLVFAQKHLILQKPPQQQGQQPRTLIKTWAVSAISCSNNSLYILVCFAALYFV
jgi:hypothetical protein